MALTMVVFYFYFVFLCFFFTITRSVVTAVNEPNLSITSVRLIFLRFKTGLFRHLIGEILASIFKYVANACVEMKLFINE